MSCFGKAWRSWERSGSVTVRRGYARCRVVMVKHGRILFCLGEVRQGDVRKVSVLLGKVALCVVTVW